MGLPSRLSGGAVVAAMARRDGDNTGGPKGGQVAGGKCWAEGRGGGFAKWQVHAARGRRQAGGGGRGGRREAGGGRRAAGGALSNNRLK